MEGQLKFADALTDRNHLLAEPLSLEDPVSHWRAPTTVHEPAAVPEVSTGRLSDSPRPWLSRSHSVLTSPNLDQRCHFHSNSVSDFGTYRRRASSASATWAVSSTEAPSSARQNSTPTVKKSIWNSPWGHLLRLHLVVILLLWWAVFLGSTFSQRKWSVLSPRLHRISYRGIEQGVGLDFDIAKRLLDTPHVVAGAAVRDAVGPLMHENRHWSFYVLGDDKRAYRQRRKQDQNYALAAFSEVLLCSSLRWDGTTPHSAENEVSSCPYEPPLPVADEEVSCDLQGFIQTPKNFTLLQFQPLKSKKLQRICVYWKEDLDGSLSPLVDRSNGLITPNYPLEAVLERLVRNPLWTIFIILLTWCHSLYTAQSWFVIHVPRLLTYVAWGIWRALVLYSLLGAIERFPGVQAFLREFDRSGAEVVDFSDHIVLYTMLCFVISTELYCLWRFRRMSKGKRRDPLVPTTEFESPALMGSVMLYALTLADLGIISLMIYAAFATAAFYHTPLESYVGVGVGVLGTFGLFYVILLFLDERLLPRRYFGLSNEQ